MKVIVKKNDEVILERDDIRSVTDKDRVYGVVYEDYSELEVYKDEGIILELHDSKNSIKWVME